MGWDSHMSSLINTGAILTFENQHQKQIKSNNGFVLMDLYQWICIFRDDYLNMADRVPHAFAFFPLFRVDGE